jgi:hypothetical protein
MAHTTEHGDAARVKFQAVLDGQSMTAQQAARDVAELFASDIEGTLRGRTSELVAFDIHALVLDVIERRHDADDRRVPAAATPFIACGQPEAFGRD